MGLTDDAKKEIQEAIRIVREDRFEKFVRSRQAPPKEDPPNDPPNPPKNDPPNPPPKNDPPENDPKNDPPKPTRRSGYWGDIFDD